MPKVNPRVAYTFISAVIIVLTTLIAIRYAKGDFRVTRQGFVRESGLLGANSFPNGAEVYINGRLVTATDDTLYLEPGQYDVEIVKDGYWPWKKTLQIERELVTQTNAQLFPVAPSLTPLTLSGAEKVMPSPDGLKLLYFTTTATNETKNGLYVIELTDSLLSLQRGPRQLSELPESFDLTQAEFLWSPDSTEVMVLSEDREVIVNTDRKQDIDALTDISFQRRQILSEWEEEMYLRERQFLKEFPDEMIAVATQSARNVYISPDKKRLLYTATEEITISDELVPPVPATNTQPQERQLVPNTVYIYDREEDTNFLIGAEKEVSGSSKALLANDLFNSDPLTLEASPSAFTSLQATQSAQIAQNFNRYHTALHLDTFQWFPDSKHILYTTDEAIQIKSYDNTNDIAVYSGPFNQGFVYPWPDGSRLVILTTFSSDSRPNLYAIDLK